MKKETETLKNMFIKLLYSKGFIKRNYEDNIREYVYFSKDRYINLKFISNTTCKVSINIELEHSSINLKMLTDDITKLEALLITSLSIN